jgi:hypothetical protein
VVCDLGDHYSIVGQRSGGQTLGPESTDFHQDVHIFGFKTIFVSEARGVLSVFYAMDCPEFFVA